jgi:hypothetical protein
VGADDDDFDIGAHRMEVVQLRRGHVLSLSRSPSADPSPARTPRCVTVGGITGRSRDEEVG